jgi:hypothetical protein
MAGALEGVSREVGTTWGRSYRESMTELLTCSLMSRSMPLRFWSPFSGKPIDGAASAGSNDWTVVGRRVVLAAAKDVDASVAAVESSAADSVDDLPIARATAAAPETGLEFSSRTNPRVDSIRQVPNFVVSKAALWCSRAAASVSFSGDPCLLGEDFLPEGNLGDLIDPGEPPPTDRVVFETRVP